MDIGNLIRKQTQHFIILILESSLDLLLVLLVKLVQENLGF